MVEAIKSIKDALLEQVEQDLQEKGATRVDPKAVDMIKDLAEAEKSCWEAEYYATVTEAMQDGSMGYDDQMGYDRRGYHRGRMGYRGQPRDSMGRYRSGYREGRYGHDDVMQSVKDMMASADPQEREQIRKKLRQMADM